MFMRMRMTMVMIMMIVIMLMTVLVMIMIMFVVMRMIMTTAAARVMRVMMIIASAGSYFINEKLTSAQYATANKMDFEMPLTRLVWITSVISIALTYVVSWLVIPSLGGNTNLWWQLSTIISCGTLAGAIIPELVKVFTSTSSGHVQEVVTSSREGGASLNILSGFGEEAGQPAPAVLTLAPLEVVLLRIEK